MTEQHKYKNDINIYSHFERMIFIETDVLSQQLTVTEAKAKYDQYSRHVVSSKGILSQVFQSAIPEFKDMKTEDIIKCIENNPLIHQVGVYTGELIDGRSNDIIDFSDGKNVMDIVCAHK